MNMVSVNSDGAIPECTTHGCISVSGGGSGSGSTASSISSVIGSVAMALGGNARMSRLPGGNSSRII